jgi:outer membrane protein assembly factor BamD
MKVYNHKSLGFYCVIIIVGISGLGCGGGKTFVAESADMAYDHAMESYQKGDYKEAGRWFQRVIFNYPGDELIDKAMFYLADSYFRDKDYLMAANEFKRVSSEFPDEPLAMQSLYKLGICYSRLSLDYELDQTDTRRAVDTFNSLIERFPRSEFSDSARVRISALQAKLAHKEYENGHFYYKRHYYDSAIIQFETLRQEYPDNPWLPPTLYYLSKAYEKLELNEDADKTRRELIESFPESDEAKKIMQEFPSLVSGERASVK